MGIPVVETFQATIGSAAQQNIGVAHPAGIVAGEVGIVIVVVDASNQASDLFNTPIGWNKILAAYGNDSSYDVASVAYWRVMTGDANDNTPNVTWATNAEAIGWYLRVSGVDNDNPLNVTGSNDFAISTALSVLGVTTLNDDCLAFYHAAFDGGDGYPFSVAGTGWSESDEQQYDTAATTVSGCWGTKEQATAGATGTATVTASSNDGICGFQFALRGEVSASHLRTRRHIGFHYG